MNIPLAKTCLGDEEARAAGEAIRSGWVTQGPKVLEFESAFATLTGSSYACAVSSCTTALHLALTAAGVKPGDVVITVSHSFIATANAVRHAGAEPLFADIDPATFNMTPEGLKRLIEGACRVRGGALYVDDPGCPAQGRVAAVMPVHQLGMPCDMGGIVGVAKAHGLKVIEDAACAIGSRLLVGGGWQLIGKPHSDAACFSFHPRKVITTGDGGMITTNDPASDAAYRLLRQHGMSVPDTKRHSSREVIFEEYVLTGYNYRMTDIQAAVGLEQLKRLGAIVEGRRAVAARYRDALSAIKGLTLPSEPSWARTNWQSYCVGLPEGPDQRAVMQSMLDRGISTRRGVMCAHLEPPYRHRYWEGRLTESERAHRRSVILPLYHGMTEDETGAVADALRTALRDASA